MDPIPYYFDSINRNAIIIKPKKLFYDWLNSVFPDNDLINEEEENNIYLIQEMNSKDKVVRWIRKNFEKIFANELNDWYSDEDKWPKNRTYKMFSEWFEIEIHSMILDMEEYEITKE